MRILCVCDEGISRSPTIAALLYKHEAIPVGTHRTSAATRAVLSDWCDLAIFTSPSQRKSFPDIPDSRVMVWPIGDHYPRPFNPELRKLVLRLIDQKGL